MLAVPTGVHLADWQSIADGWSVADRAVFAAFVDERIRPAMTGVMANVRERQEALLKSPSLGGAFANMWQNGIHPLQSDVDD